MSATEQGVLFAILELTKNGLVPTVEMIGATAQLHCSTASKIANQLADRGIVLREQLVASHGRGYRYCYRPRLMIGEILPFCGPVDVKPAEVTA